MKRSLKASDAGFGALELLAIIGVLLLTGAAAAYAISLHSSVFRKPSAAHQGSVSKASTTLAIKELDIQFPLDGFSDGLVYQVRQNPDGSSMALIDTPTSARECGAGKLGEIVKTPGMIPSNLRPYFTTDENGARTDYMLKQSDGFYVQVVPSTNPCDLKDGSVFPTKATALQFLRDTDRLVTTATDKDLIVAAIEAKYPKSAWTRQYWLCGIENDYAIVSFRLQGNVENVAGGAGGAYLKKTQGTWSVIYDGQNMDSATVKALGIPSALLNSCSSESPKLFSE